MNDDQIIQLYFDRSEQAIKETDTKYGGYCYSIAYNILTNPEDAEESVSDTYLPGRHFWGKSPGIFPLTDGESTAPSSGARGRSSLHWRNCGNASAGRKAPRKRPSGRKFWQA